MIGKMKLYPGSAAVPMCPLHVFAGSPATVEICGIPRDIRGVTIEAVTLGVVNADGMATVSNAVRAGGVWTATLPAAAFGDNNTAAEVHNGVTVSASGRDETGTARCWTLGVGDLVIVSLAASAVTPEGGGGQLRPLNGQTFELSSLDSVYSALKAALEAMGATVSEEGAENE